MLEHGHIEPAVPRRVVILGSRGFVAATVARDLSSASVAIVPLGREDLDLTGPTADATLAARLTPTDAVIFVAAKVPCKTPDAFRDNIQMAHAVAKALSAQPVAHLVYVSSDAVYGDGETMVRETTPAAPTSLHGAMHAAREALLRFGLPQIPLAILRPSLLYGADDPHNGYGPNSFRRLAAAGKPITLFGEGEEMRDHVSIIDVARIVALVLRHRSTGILNVATGWSLSFRQAAELAVAQSPNPVEIQGTPRKNPISHRHFDPTNRIKAFPDFVFTPIEQGLRGG